mmetsp:Transcript_74077/g.123736  ORF Transcript_74077/g.123736 Transcript_74077/m.123736 type:complete len:277 (-) Transcript_74077:305-1135(-)|eukprot:CAMPEP_0119333848 /NCGR_PEP_ID=MMETSP1333-20130426/86118_1 /TAXON_ID=418940 /ORGANISM="Scyphosphaera apsteinii, Strain RCC1455" /LENGTH=276 /DNA_ID=CAMNT_0007344015 /DNA_START=24 /DNA_END=854 /DNA_ORIENTATION=+
MSLPDITTLKEYGNQCMSGGDYVNAMKYYSQCIAIAPKDATLYSNRSFAFLRLNMPARALADAEEAIKRRPDWPKGHFRRAEALSQAGLYDEALLSYQHGSRLDASDEHLRSQAIAAAANARRQKRYAQAQVAIGALIGALLFALLVFSPQKAIDETLSAAARRRQEANKAGSVTSAFVLLAGTLLGAAAGYGALLLQQYNRRGVTLPPLDSNDRFAAMQMQGQRLPSNDSSAPQTMDASHAETAQRPAAREQKGCRGRSAKHGREAALRAAGKRA